MAGLQTIIDKSNSLSIDRRKLVGIQYTRNEIARVSVTPTKNPWKFTLELPNSLRYNEARSLLEQIDRLDRITPQIVSFGINPNLSWLFKYQGSMTSAQISGITVVSYVGDQLTLGTLPVIPSTRVMFEPNDLIQIVNNPYPMTSVNQVLRGSGSTVTFTVSRPNILTTVIAGEGIVVGPTCQFNLFCPNMPTYKLLPGATLYNASGTLINNAHIEWNDSFNLTEFVGTA